MSASGHKASRKNRTAMSCERCKSRKTKCSNPVPGPCDQCCHADAVCYVDVGKRRQKPYYTVSEEEYRHMQKILKHYLPDTELNLATLRSIALQCSERQRGDAVQSSRTALVEPLPSAPSAPIATDLGSASEAPPRPSEDDLALREIVNVHQDLGCMMADASGHYRYVGADSGLTFNTAVRELKRPSPRVPGDKDVVPGLRAVTLPVPTTKGTPQFQHWELPPRELMLQCVSRYFAQIHCLHWLYSSEEFHTRFHTTYADADHPRSASWLCSLYCIFILGSATNPPLNGASDWQSAENCLEATKSLVARVCDEADLDSIRALFLLALTLQFSAFSNSAYLYMGLAVRTAFSLGLHLDKFPTHDLLRREHARRIWWSLYIYDQELASWLGKPCMTGAPNGVSWQTQVPSEEILNPGPYTPPGYLQLSISLTHIRKSARNALYIEPMSGGKKPTLADFEATLSSLREWLACVPPYLSHSAPSAPLYMRSIAVLHVRYWSAVIFVCRPFLLCLLLRRTQLQQTASVKFFEEMSSVCVDAAEHSLEIQRRVVEEGLFSSVLIADFYYALDLLQIFLAAHSLDRSERPLKNANTCLEVLKTLGQSGYCQKMLPEVLNQMRDWGALNATSDVYGGFEDLDALFTAMEQDTDAYQLHFDTSEAFNQEAINVDFLNTASNDELMRQIVELSAPPSSYNAHNFTVGT